VKNPNQQWGQTLSIKKATLPITAVYKTEKEI
jgi:hypothetical protein